MIYSYNGMRNFFPKLGQEREEGNDLFVTVSKRSSSSKDGYANSSKWVWVGRSIRI